MNKQLENLKESVLEYVKNGTYDFTLMDWSSEKLDTEEKRIDAFNRFSSKADYDEYMNLAFTAGQLDIINQLKK